MILTWAWWTCLAIVAVAWLLWISRGTDDADPNTLSYRFHRAWRRIAFWAGDVRLDWQLYFGVIPFPLISWTHHEYAVSPELLLNTCKVLRRGDVMLATKFGYIFSNMAIPGCFKHAGIITDECVEGARVLGLDENGQPFTGRVLDPTEMRLVEAISEGVVRRHPLHARGDCMIFLRPKHMTDRERDKAASTADKLVGCKYDASFNFNISEELSYLDESVSKEELDYSTAILRRAEMNHRAEYDLAFSCTEAVAAAWWFRRRQLGIARKLVRGRMCITADQFVSRDFSIVWTNVTVKEAEKAGLHEEGLRELEAYWNGGVYARGNEAVQECKQDDEVGGQSDGQA